MKTAIAFLTMVLTATIASPVCAQIGGGMGMGGSGFPSARSGTLFGGSSGGIGQSGFGSNFLFSNAGGFPGAANYGGNAYNPNSMGYGLGNSFGMGNYGMMNRGMNTNRNSMGQNFGGTNNGSQGLRISIDLGSSPPPSKIPHFSSALTKRLEGLPSLKTLGSVEVLIQGSTAILRGTVPTDRSRDLAGRLMLLEPGIDQVQNELTVGEPPSSVPAK